MGTVQTTYQKAKKRIFFLDYDGTLVGFRRDPQKSAPTKRVLRLLAKLASDPRNIVVVISGRSQKSLDTWLGHLPINLVAEHGYFVKPSKETWRSLTAVPTGWKNETRKYMEQAVKATPGTFIEEKVSALVWHYRTARNPRLVDTSGLVLALNPLAKANNLRILLGNKNVELRPHTTDKGRISKHWLANGSWDFVLAAGDDTTDEDLFAAMPAGALTIKIGKGESVARLREPTPNTFLALLEGLTKQ